MTGRWGADTKRAMSAFLLAANARLPIDQPDDDLLSLVQSHDHASCGERLPTEVQLVAPIESKSGPDRPPGLMGIGGPKPGSDEPFAKPAGSAAPSSGLAIRSSRETTRRRGDSGAQGNEPPRVIPGQRSVHELLIHPLGRF